MTQYTLVVAVIVVMVVGIVVNGQFKGRREFVDRPQLWVLPTEDSAYQGVNS